MKRRLFDFTQDVRDWTIDTLDRIEFIAMENRQLSEILVVGLTPALFVMILLLVAGVRTPWLVVGLFVFSFLLFGGIAFILPREVEPEVRIRGLNFRRPKSRFEREIAPLVASLQNRETRRPELFKIHPPIADDSIISASIYLNRSGYNAANLSGTDNVLNRVQERKLRDYMIDNGLAFQFRDGDRLGWSLNAAGRSMIREYITQLLLDEIDAQLSGAR
jgi:hypothetical protein